MAVALTTDSATDYTITLPLPDIPVVEEQKQEPLSDEILCNCYAYTKQTYPTLPSTKTIKANLSQYGPVAVFYYPSSGLHHFAVVKRRQGGILNVREANYKSCQETHREITVDYPYLIGFYTPPV